MVKLQVLRPSGVQAPQLRRCSAQSFQLHICNHVNAACTNAAVLFATSNQRACFAGTRICCAHEERLLQPQAEASRGPRAGQGLGAVPVCHHASARRGPACGKRCDNIVRDLRSLSLVEMLCLYGTLHELQSQMAPLDEGSWIRFQSHKCVPLRRRMAQCCLQQMMHLD